jgi:hypothetical protein
MEERRQGEETLMSPISPDTMASEYADGLGWYKSSKPYEYSPMATPALNPNPLPGNAGLQTSLPQDGGPYTLSQFKAFDALLRAAVELDKGAAEATYERAVKGTLIKQLYMHFGLSSRI